MAFYVFSSLFSAADPTYAADKAPFYRGKTLTVVINFAGGGPTDIEGRVIAKQLAKHIPGNPPVTSQGMGGGGTKSFEVGGRLFKVASQTSPRGRRFFAQVHQGGEYVTAQLARSRSSTTVEAAKKPQQARSSRAYWGLTVPGVGLVMNNSPGRHRKSARHFAE